MRLDEERARVYAVAQNARSKLECNEYGARSNTDVPDTSANSIPAAITECYLTDDVHHTIRTWFSQRHRGRGPAPTPHFPCGASHFCCAPVRGADRPHTDMLHRQLAIGSDWRTRSAAGAGVPVKVAPVVPVSVT